MQERRIWSLGWEDPLEEGMATHSSILAWRIHGQRILSGQQSMGLQRIGHDWVCKNKKEKLSRLRRSHNHTPSPARLLGLSRPLEVGNFPQHPPCHKEVGAPVQKAGPYQEAAASLGSSPPLVSVHLSRIHGRLWPSSGPPLEAMLGLLRFFFSDKNTSYSQAAGVGFEFAVCCRPLSLPDLTWEIHIPASSQVDSGPCGQWLPSPWTRVVCPSGPGSPWPWCRTSLLGSDPGGVSPCLSPLWSCQWRWSSKLLQPHLSYWSKSLQRNLTS